MLETKGKYISKDMLLATVTQDTRIFCLIALLLI